MTKKLSTKDFNEINERIYKWEKILDLAKEYWVTVSSIYVRRCRDKITWTSYTGRPVEWVGKATYKKPVEIRYDKVWKFDKYWNEKVQNKNYSDWEWNQHQLWRYVNYRWVPLKHTKYEW